MKKIYSVIVLLALVLSTDFYGQCSLYPVSLPSKVTNSSLIIEGKVISQKSFWNADRNYIYTSNLISVNQVLKGAVYTSAIEIITEGGQVDLNKQVVDPSLQLNINDEGVFTLNTFNQSAQFGNPVYQVYADQQGFIKFNLKENTASVPFKEYNTINNVYSELEMILGVNLPGFVNPNTTNRFSSVSSIASVSGISPTTLSAGTASVLTITGSGFGATQGTSIVEFLNADDGGATYIQPDITQYVSWNNNQIQVMVPTKAGPTAGTAGTGPIRVTVGTSTVSTQTLTIPYGEINAYYSNTITTQAVFNTRHIGLNGMNGITWQMYTSFDANATAKAAYLRAFQTWRCNTNINWVLGPTVTTNTIALDNVDVIRFDIGSELPAGVLGRCTSYFNGCYLGPNVWFYIAELDICFDDPATSAITWNFGPANATGSQYDFESVTVHELGHGHQLSHVINNADVMHYSIASAVNKRTLIAANINAGNDLMSRSTSAAICAKPNMIAITPSLCSVGSPTPAFSLVSPICVGQVVAVNSSTTSSATNFSWTMTGGSTSTSTLMNTSTSYPSSGIYSITLLATNGVGSTSLTHTISIVAIPVVSVPSSNICSGTNATLTATGATSYTWNPGNLTGATQVLSPAITQVYTVLGSNGTCTNTSTGTINVTTTPTVSVPSAVICSGSPTLITASGATNYTFNPGALIGASQSLNPSTTTPYTVTGANGSCIVNKTFTITVNTTPTVSATSSSTLICTGQTATLTASGATSYTYNPGALTGSVVSVSPTSSTSYTVDGQIGSCSATSFVTVSVSLCTGINKLNNLQELKLYPNPTEGIVNLNFGEEFSGQVTLFNSLGQLLINQKLINSESTELDLSVYPKGVYLIKLNPANGKGSVLRVVRD